jgi:hypothetical protein
VGHQAIAREGRWLAAVLACEPHAVLSHRTAAALWGLVREDRQWPVEVTSPRKTKSTSAIRRHYGSPTTDEIGVRRGIPVTSLERTLLDYAAQRPGEPLDAALREAEYLHRIRPGDLFGYLERQRGRRGAARLRDCLLRLEQGPRGRTRSRLETKFAVLLSRAGLPPPALNALLDLDGRKIEADCLWRAERLIVELDGRRAHGTKSAQASDSRRDRLLQEAGWRVVRLTWQDLEAPEALILELRRLLAESVSGGAYPPLSGTRRGGVYVIAYG